MDVKFRKRLKAIAANYGATVKFVPNMRYAGGYYSGDQHQISLSTVLTRKEAMDCLFHELGHHHCRVTGIWVRYHQLNCAKAYRIKNGYNAECWVDAWGAKEFKKWFPKGYYGAYWKAYLPGDLKRKTWLREYWG